MDQALSIFNSIIRPIQDLYIRAFNANKIAAGIGFSVLITFGLFSIMVILIALGDSGMKEDSSVKILHID